MSDSTQSVKDAFNANREVEHYAQFIQYDHELPLQNPMI